MMTRGASGPPAISRKRSRMNESSRAPPATTSVPRFGPTSCAEAPAPATTSAIAPSKSFRIRVPPRRRVLAQIRVDGAMSGTEGLATETQRHREFEVKGIAAGLLQAEASDAIVLLVSTDGAS